MLRTVHCTADPHGRCRHVWVEYLHRTFLSHSKAVNPALNMLENINNGDLSTGGSVGSHVLSKDTGHQLAPR